MVRRTPRIPTPAEPEGDQDDNTTIEEVEVPQPVTQRRPVAQKTTRTVTVACKIPSGLNLQLQRPMDRMEDTRDGPVPRKYWVKFGQIYTVKGPAYPVGTPPKGFPRPPIIEGGYALTPGIPKDFWDQWYEQNKNADFVRPANGADHGAIFAYPDMEDAVSAAVENEKYLSGLEPISTDEDARGRLIDRRLPRPINMAITKVMPDDRMGSPERRDSLERE